MTHVMHTEIEIGALSLEIALEYDFSPGEPMVRYYPDGSGDPGCPPSAELVNATVTLCDMGYEQQTRCDHWIWRALDIIAYEAISRDWARFQEKCIEDANDRAERDYDR